MAANINVVLEGKYKGDKIRRCPQGLCLSKNFGYFEKGWISSYTVIDKTTKPPYTVLLEPMIGYVGETKSEYLIAVEWAAGGKSLIVLDGENYKVFVRHMF